MRQRSEGYLSFKGIALYHKLTTQGGIRARNVKLHLEKAVLGFDHAPGLSLCCREQRSIHGPNRPCPGCKDLRAKSRE
jgi:hypothetical protein